MNNLIYHSLEPIYDKNSKVLILGTIPSPKSREMRFYYSHPQNRFWKVISKMFSQEIPNTIEEKRLFLLKNKVALWDVLASCKIKNADDSSISLPEANDFSNIFAVTNIRAVFTAGRKATSLYKKYCVNENNKILPIYLPSTSPANCRLSQDELIEAYKVILHYIR